MIEHFDVVVVGAGLSGIGVGCHLRRHSSGRSFVILEGRERIGGTWDLFRYPGVRSDSDMFSLGYSFRPWVEDRAIADGASILLYLKAAAHENGIDPHIRYRHRVVSAEWSSAEACWRVTAECDGEAVRFTCAFLSMCTGYYDYDRGHAPAFEGAKRFRGEIVHPQFWGANIDHTGKRVVVIGSGATAVTLVPELAKTAAHVTMLQRSPTYVVSQPSVDRIGSWLRRLLPGRAAYVANRWKSVLLHHYFYVMMRKHPVQAKAEIIKAAAKELGPDYDTATHFTPRYNPWDERLCIAPDGDLFGAIREGRASIVTDTVARFTPGGIETGSGAELSADLVVTATGLEILMLGNVTLRVDGETFDPAEAITYKGMMFADVPNMAITFGYTNAAWTLKADLTAAYICRLLNTMKRRGMRQVTPRLPAGVKAEPFMSFTSGYVLRAADQLPKQGSRKPWKLDQNYLKDLLAFRFGSIDQDMEFSNPDPASRAPAVATPIS